MCFKTPKMTPVQALPDRSSVQSDVGNQRRRLAQQNGVSGSVFTSALGDPSYGRNVEDLARLGGSRNGRGGM